MLTQHLSMTMERIKYKFPNLKYKIHYSKEDKMYFVRLKQEEIANSKEFKEFINEEKTYSKKIGLKFNIIFYYDPFYLFC